MQILDETSCLIYASFGSSGRRLNIGTRRGFKVLDISGESFKEKYIVENDCGYSIVESYKGTILTVGNDDSVENSSRKLKIWSGNELKYEMMFITPIMGVRLNASYIVVCLENEIFVYDMNLKQCRNYKTKLNGRGVVALSNNDYLAYPYENDFIVTNLNDDHKKKFSANINISSIQFSNNSEKVAIVDESGKTIYIYYTRDEKLEPIKLLRGNTYAQIFQTSFSPLGEIIGVASKNTAHLFELQQSNSFLKKIYGNISTKKIKLKGNESLLSFIKYNPEVKPSQEKMFDRVLIAIISTDGYLEKYMFTSGVEKKLGRYKVV